MQNKSRGFTLIELLVVVLIIGILAAVAVPQYNLAVEKTRAAEALINLRALVRAEEVYKMTNGVATNDMSQLDISIDSDISKNFSYVLAAPRSSGVGFEVVAYRKHNNNDVFKYYIYYSYTRSLICVAQSESAKKICHHLSRGKKGNAVGTEIHYTIEAWL